LGRLLKFKNDIEVIDLSNNLLEYNQLQCFNESIDSNNLSQLRILNLSNNPNLFSKKADLIVKIIKNCKNLEQLNIAKTGIGYNFEKLVKEILKSIRDTGSSNLKVLNLIKNNIDSKSLKLLSELIKNPICKIEKLIISENSLNNEGGMLFIESIGDNKSLLEIMMFNCDLIDSNINGIRNILNKNKTLKNFKLYDHHFTLEGVKTLLKTLSETETKNENEENDIQMLDFHKQEEVTKKAINLRSFDLSKKEPENFKFDDDIINYLIAIKKKYEERNSKLSLDVKNLFESNESFENNNNTSKNYTTFETLISTDHCGLKLTK